MADRTTKSQADIIGEPIEVAIVAGGSNDNYAVQVDNISTTGVTYVGKATIGSTTSSSVWQIQRIDESGTPTTTVIKWADGDADFDNIWDNRTSLTYL